MVACATQSATIGVEMEPNELEEANSVRLRLGEPAQTVWERFVLIASIALVSVALAYAEPYALGVGFVLPMVFVALGTVRPSTRWQAHVRFLEDELEIEQASQVVRIEWRAIQITTDQLGRFVFLHDGVPLLTLPRTVSQRPEVRRALMTISF